MLLSRKYPAIYVHNTKAVPYADAIAEALKTIETRTRDMLGRFVGSRVLIIRTADGKKPMIIGSVCISHGAYRSAEELENLRDRTLIPPGSKFDCHGAGKWCYFLRNAVKFQHEIPLEDARLISRNMSYAIIDAESLEEWRDKHNNN